MERVHNKFRLWLTTEPTPQFPVSLLQISLKITVETPRGIRSNLNRSFIKIGKERIDNFADSLVGTRLLYGLCLFHAVLQERKKFGSLGWNRIYEFNENDLIISLKQLETAYDAERKNKTPTSPLFQLETIKYLVGECFYGGRITDNHDRLCLTHLLDQFYSENITKLNHNLIDIPLYPLPDKGGYNSLLETIKSYPINDHPEIFGMHENARITCANNQTQQLFDTIVSIQPKYTIESSFNLEENRMIQTLQFIDQSLTSIWNSKNEPKFAIETCSLYSILNNEIVNYAKLIQIIKGSIQQIEQGVKGIISVTTEMEDLMKSIYYGTVPKQWQLFSYLR